MTEQKNYVNRDDWAVLANLSDQAFHSDQAGLGLYTIPPCAAGERCSLTSVYGRTEMYDMGDDRKGERYWPARMIAKSVLMVFFCARAIRLSRTSCAKPPRGATHSSANRWSRRTRSTRARPTGRS